jgi:hypothetical protein
MAQRYLDVLDELTAACTQPGPSLYTISRTGLRRVLLD